MAVAELTVGAAGVLFVASSENAGIDRALESCSGSVMGTMYATRTEAVRLTACVRRSVSVDPLAETLETVRVSSPPVTVNADLFGSGSSSRDAVNATATVQPVTVAELACTGVRLVSEKGSNEATWLAGVDVSLKGELVCSWYCTSTVSDGATAASSESVTFAPLT